MSIALHWVTAVENDTVFVDNARVVTADMDASNGIIHVIDPVIMPGQM